MGARGATASWLLAAREGEGLTELCATKEKSEIFGKRGNAGNVGTGGSGGAAVGAAAVGGTAGAGVNGIGAVVMRGLKTDLKNGWVLSMNPRNGRSPGPRFQTQQGLRFRGWGWSQQGPLPWAAEEVETIQTRQLTRQASDDYGTSAQRPNRRPTTGQ